MKNSSYNPAYSHLVAWSLSLLLICMACRPGQRYDHTPASHRGTGSASIGVIFAKGCGVVAGDG
ncbi:MAG: hypothetical protein LUD74_08560, partial [Tannerellaceae bacterium]|nr:hypothetical protein [Tannerellaceae bacterium]